jgi:hypothetical protein
MHSAIFWYKNTAKLSDFFSSKISGLISDEDSLDRSSNQSRLHLAETFLSEEPEKRVHPKIKYFAKMKW